MIALRKLFCLTAFCPLLASVLCAEVSCPAIFGDHMVLQRDRAVKVWGEATAGEDVVVEFAGQSKSTKAGTDGHWQVALAPLLASAESRPLTVRGANTLTFSDVLVGEVWFCSGQSNMEKPLGPRKGQKPTDNYEAELAQSACATLRLFQVPHNGKAKTGDATLVWLSCNADTLTQSNFSAAAYYFGRELTRELGVPVGLIHSSFGGTMIEAWIPQEGFANEPELHGLESRKYDAWVPGVQATELYQTMVAPYVPFTLRGFLWYQGEANCMNAEHLIYATKMRALVSSWRAAWHDSSAPFYYALLAPFTYSRIKTWPKQLTPDALPALWEAQIHTLAVPHTGIITTTDLAGSAKDIHPTNKRDVGLRFSDLALANTYGRTNAKALAPNFSGAKLSWRGHKMVMSVQSGDGLRSRDNLPLTEFTIAGEDRQFHPAEAKIESGKVIVTSPLVAKPVAVRFAWHELANPNLVNAAGLPALPFRTDDWPIVLEVPKAAAARP